MMFNYHHFDEVFNFDPRCIYDEDAIHNIEANRKLLQGLFLDKVFKVLGIKRRTYTNVVQKYMLIHLVAVKHYPPKSDTDLRNLHKAVVESSGADHHKISVLYYILLDFDAPTGRRIHSTAFEENTFLPQKYQIYMKGLWHLDRLDLEVALQYLTYPSLIPTFPDEILEVLIRLAKNDDFTLPLAYYHTVQPALCSSQAIESLLSAIARTNVTEAFYFCRSQQEYTQRHMFEMLTSLVLNNSPNDTIASRSVELVNLPFTMEEEVWLEDYLLHGEGRTIRKSIDTLMMRKIGTGRFTESLDIKDTGTKSRAIGGMDWNILASAVEDGLDGRLDVM